MDVEKWVQEHTQRVYFRDRYGDSDYTLECVDIADLRDLLNGRILCDAEPVATTLLPDPYGEPDESSDGPWFSHKDWQQLEALGAGVKLYKAAGDGEG